MCIRDRSGRLRTPSSSGRFAQLARTIYHPTAVGTYVSFPTASKPSRSPRTRYYSLSTDVLQLVLTRPVLPLDSTIYRSYLAEPAPSLVFAVESWLDSVAETYLMSHSIVVFFYVTYAIAPDPTARRIKLARLRRTRAKRFHRHG